MNDPLSDPTQTSSSPIEIAPTDPTQTDNTPQTWIAFHNTLIIGFFTDEQGASEALQGYTMSNNIDINDVTGVNQLT